MSYAGSNIISAFFQRLKTINGQPIIGSGNIDVGGGSFSGTLDNISEGTTNKHFSVTEKDKLSGIAAGANNYSHPINHIPSIITQDANNRFVSDTEKSIWNGKSDVGHNHSLSNLTEKSYNSLADKPDLSSLHTHSNKLTLDNIQEALTTLLKGNYDGAYSHSQTSHAPANAQKNSDITKAEIETKLTGEISTHTHGGSSGGISLAIVRQLTRR